MYYENNKGVLAFDGAEWQLVRLPNHTIASSIALGSGKKRYVGGQDKLGYLRKSDLGMLVFHSLVSKIPEACRGFEDVLRIIYHSRQIEF